MSELKRTPLYDKHVQSQGQIVEFAGYELPIQYAGISEEHQQVRNKAGLFDVSHMGEVEVIGEDALSFVQHLVTNDVKKLVDNQVLYTMMCYEDGCVVDDLLVYRFSETHFYLVINASNVLKDFEWIESHIADYDVAVTNISNHTAQLAIQGPLAQTIMQKLIDFDLKEIAFFHFKRNVLIKDIDVLISRTGYTGEDGFEIYCSDEEAPDLWQLLLDTGGEDLQPIGLGARDTLRFEACLPLYGHEISDTINPIEAGLKMFVKLETDDFIGKDVLVSVNTQGAKRKLVGIELAKGIARTGAIVLKDGKEIGFVTTGYKSPTLNKSIALALVEIGESSLGNYLEVQVRKKVLTATVISKRFYKKNYKK